MRLQHRGGVGGTTAVYCIKTSSSPMGSVDATTGWNCGTMGSDVVREPATNTGSCGRDDIGHATALC